MPRTVQQTLDCDYCDTYVSETVEGPSLPPGWQEIIVDGVVMLTCPDCEVKEVHEVISKNPKKKPSGKPGPSKTKEPAPPKEKGSTK